MQNLLIPKPKRRIRDKNSNVSLASDELVKVKTDLGPNAKGLHANGLFKILFCCQLVL